MFSYKPQIDDGGDDGIIGAVEGCPGPSGNQLPHQLSCSSIRTENSDFVYQQKERFMGSKGSPERIQIESAMYASSSFSPDSIQSNSIN